MRLASRWRVSATPSPSPSPQRGEGIPLRACLTPSPLWGEGWGEGVAPLSPVSPHRNEIREGGLYWAGSVMTSVGRPPKSPGCDIALHFVHTFLTFPVTSMVS